MEQNKDQIGAAVRGEAVAMPAIRYEHKNKFHDGDYVEFVVGALYGYLIKQGVPKAAYYFSRDEAADYVAQGYWTEASVPIAPVSARAADVPSEPSEQELWDDNGEPMNDAAEKEWRQSNERIRQRAADALDSQPGTDEPTDREALIACLGDDAVTLLRANPGDEMAQTMREAAAMLEKDGKALDSQPTEPVADVQARVRDAVAENLRGLYYCGRVWSAWSVGTMGEDDFSPAEEDDDIIANITDAVMATFAPASSQPTDGGVRNGRAELAKLLAGAEPGDAT